MAKFARKKKQGCQTPKSRICYVARDKSNRLFLYDEKPVREKARFNAIDGDCQELSIYAFPQVTWENSPWQVTMTLDFSCTTGETNSYDRYYEQ